MAIELGPADTGTSRSVRIGDVTTVRLPESPTTGYRWHSDPDSDADSDSDSDTDSDDVRLKIVEDRFEGAEQPRGAGGDRVLVFEAVRVGLARVHLSKRRSWESGVPLEEFWVELDVQPRQPV
jgi:inhibitor of cysteine peptidase